MRIISYKAGSWRRWAHSTGTWIRRHRLPWLAAFCTSCVWATDSQSIAAFIGLTSLLIVAFALPRVFVAVALVLGGWCAILHWQSLNQLATERSIVASTQWTSFEARIEKITPSLHGSWKAEALLASSPHPTSIQKIVLLGRSAAPQLGETISTSGRWEPIPGPRNEGEFDRRAHLARHGIVAQCRVSAWQTIQPPNLGWKLTARARQGFEKALVAGLDPASEEAKVIHAMVLGKQPIAGDAVVEPFRQTGTLHLFSVSGQHVNLVAVILWLGLRWLRIPRRHAVFFLIPAIFSYAWITGASAPAMRAAWMASLFLAAFVFQRKSDLMQALSLVIIAALLIDSQMLFLPGVQLSYGIVAVISIGLSLSRHLLDRFSWNDPYVPRELLTPWQLRCENGWHGLLQSIFISCSAFVGSSFLTVAYFSMITPISILANLLLTPLVAALLALSLLASALSPLSTTAASWCNQCNRWVARSCLVVTQQCASIPGSHWVISMHRTREDTLRIFDLPRGGSAISIQGKKADALLDCGNARSFSSIVLPSLRHFGQQPQALLLSNPTAGHSGGASQVLEQFSLQQIVAPPPAARTPSLRKLMSAAVTKNVPCTIATPGTRILLSPGIAVAPGLVPHPQDIPARADEQNVIYEMDFHGYRLVFVQDASALMLQDGIDAQKIAHCDVLILGRNRIHSPTLVDLIIAYRPRAIVASHADFPLSESIPEDWQAIARRRNVVLFHQGQTGMVTARLAADGSLTLHSFLTEQTCHWASPLGLRR